MPPLASLTSINDLERGTTLHAHPARARSGLGAAASREQSPLSRRKLPISLGSPSFEEEFRAPTNSDSSRQGPDSNRRPLGYEPNALPLRHPALRDREPERCSVQLPDLSHKLRSPLNVSSIQSTTIVWQLPPDHRREKQRKPGKPPPPPQEALQLLLRQGSVPVACSLLQVKLAGFHTFDESFPLVVTERQDRAIQILAVTNQDLVCDSHFDTGTGVAG